VDVPRPLDSRTVPGLSSQQLNPRGYLTHQLTKQLTELTSVRVALWMAIYRKSVRLGAKPLRPTSSIFFFKLNLCGYSPYATSSLPRRWVCHLQSLLALISAVILRSESRGTHDHILLSQIQDSYNPEGWVPVFKSPRNRVAQLYPHALGSVFVARHGPHRKYHSSVVAYGTLSSCLFLSRYLATGLHAPIHTNASHEHYDSIFKIEKFTLKM
jgi:hypothetical protein